MPQCVGCCFVELLTTTTTSGDDDLTVQKQPSTMRSTNRQPDTPSTMGMPIIKHVSQYILLKTFQFIKGAASGFYSRVFNKKLSYCWETVRRESMPRIAEIDVEMTT